MFALFTNIPTPHKVSMFNALYDRLEGALEVFFFGVGGDKRKGWEKYLDKAKFKYQFMDSKRFDLRFKHDPGYIFLSGRIPPLDKYKKIVVSGGISPVEINIVIKALRTGKPFIIWSGAVSLRGGSRFLIPIRYLLRRYSYSHAEYVVAANSLAEAHARRMGAKRTAIAYTSFDIHRFDYDRIHRGEDLKILNIGRIIKRKRLKDLLRALYLIRDTYNWSLDIVGGGPEKSEIEKEIKRLSLDDRVKLLPPVPYEKVPEIYRKYNLFVLPSENEVHGFVVMEALMSSVPVIVTDEVGAKDFVIPEAIYPVGNIEELKRRIEWMRNPENRNRAVRYGKELIKSKATPEKWAEVFYRCLKKHEVS